MTEYKKEDVDALLADLHDLKSTIHISHFSHAVIDKMLTKFKPKLDKVVVLRNWVDRTENENDWCRKYDIDAFAWKQLSVYTAREPAPEKYKMPDWDVVCQTGKHAIRNHKIPLNIDGMNWGLGEEVYRALATFINGLSK